MARKGEVYKCEACGAVVAVIQDGDGDLVCCGEDMRLVSGSEAKNFMAGLPKIGAV